jgi:hypothetical protein
MAAHGARRLTLAAAPSPPLTADQLSSFFAVFDEMRLEKVDDRVDANAQVSEDRHHDREDIFPDVNNSSYTHTKYSRQKKFT